MRKPIFTLALFGIASSSYAESVSLNCERTRDDDTVSTELFVFDLGEKTGERYFKNSFGKDSLYIFGDLVVSSSFISATKTAGDASSAEVTETFIISRADLSYEMTYKMVSPLLGNSFEKFTGKCQLSESATTNKKF